MVPPRRKKVESPRIDRDKLHAKLRRLGDEYVFYMLDDALDVLSDAQLAGFVGQYIKLEEVAPDDASGTGKRSLRDAVAAFDAACRRGEYYVSFMVNSRNCMDTSSGTRSFIADCRRLFERAVSESADDRADAEPLQHGPGTGAARRDLARGGPHDRPVKSDAKWYSKWYSRRFRTEKWYSEGPHDSLTGLIFGGRSRDRTCDFDRVKVALYR